MLDELPDGELGGGRTHGPAPPAVTVSPMMATGDAPGQGAAAARAPAERLKNQKITDRTTLTGSEAPGGR